MSNQSDLQQLIRYILTFLLYDSEQAAALVGYTDNPAEWDKYQLVILPSGHLGKDWVLPDLANPRREGKFISLDIVYNTAFFLSRAEELLTTERDEHGRFAAAYSLLGEQNRLQIPLLDEYSRFLTKALEHACDETERTCPARLPEPGFSLIYLTHDLDSVEQYRHLRGALGGIARGQLHRVFNAWRDIHNDPIYTFPWIVEQDKQLQHNLDNVDIIYFVKHTRGFGYDYPQYCLHGRDYRRLEHLLTASGAQLGLHSSYYGHLPYTLPEAPQGSRLHRSHYLRCSIDQMERLVAAGVTDDFTMAFPDRAGFRLQTTRPARWINPKTWQLTPLTLHPLTVMDCTLSNTNYMNLSEDEAYYYCQRLFDKVRQNAGELVLLWHNNIFTPDTYHRRLYTELLKYI